MPFTKFLGMYFLWLHGTRVRYIVHSSLHDTMFQRTVISMMKISYLMQIVVCSVAINVI